MRRLVCMGTAAFAVPALERLIGEYAVAGVVTQPDKRAGRGRRMVISPVKKIALVHSLLVLQPKTFRSAEAVQRLKELEPELIVVAAYGLILPPSVLAIPPYGCLNLHASLLPKYRGAAPVAAAILAGEEETGVSIILMDEGMDTGPLLAQRKVKILPEDTGESLTERLSFVGAELLVETLPGWLRGELSPQPQDDGQASYAPPLKKADGVIDWSLSAIEIWRRVRAYYPWPSAYTLWWGKFFKILRAKPLLGWLGGEEPGRVLSLADGPAVVTGQGALLLDEVQLEGRKTMRARDFARGQRDFIGSRLGE